MEELSQKEQISVIFIPPDTAPTSVGAKEGFAEGSGLVEPWDLGNAPAYFRELHWLKKATFSPVCVPLFLLFVGFSVHKHFRDRGWCSPRGAAAHSWDWWDSTTLKVFSSLKSVIPRLLTTVASQGLSQHSSHLFIWGIQVGQGLLWMKRQRFKTSQRNLPGCRVSLHTSHSKEGLFSSQSQRKKTPLSGQ